MEDKSKYFVVKQKAVPEVLLKVVEAKKLLETVRAITVQEAADRVPGKYPYHPSEYSGQRSRYFDTECGSKGRYGKCFQYDR